MNPFAALAREARYIIDLTRILRRVRRLQNDPDLLVPDQLEPLCDKHADRIAVMGDAGLWTYAEMDAYANRVANWALAQGFKPGDTVALFMRNHIEYAPIWYGLSKVGVVTALLNNQLTGGPLGHCLRVSEAGAAILDAGLADLFQGAEGMPNLPVWASGGPVDGAEAFDAAVAAQSSARPDRAHRAGRKAAQTCLKLFTSGTTGMPKAAPVTHTRALTYLNTFASASKSGPADRVMMVLPMYHATGGLCGTGVAWTEGGALIVRERFSASRFWEDVHAFEATILMYVGELCRFLMARPEHALERGHKLRCAIGNGLRGDVWRDFQRRTGVKTIVEFYGATEGNVALINIGGEPGSIGRVPDYLKSRFNLELIAHDVETGQAIRGADGRGVIVEPGQTGEAVGRIVPGDPRYRFDGYGDGQATETKILRDLFEDGDAWFRTGDLMRRDANGNYFFVDRVGDTFRWMAENVATNEVEDVISAMNCVQEAVVYGVEVPGYDGRAGMAAISPDGELSLDRLLEKLEAQLPAYARPVFVRLQDQAVTTGTFKYQKSQLKSDGFDPSAIAEPIFYYDRETGRYEPLDQPVFERIRDGRIRF